MKRILLPLIFIFLLTACASSQTAPTATAAATNTTTLTFTNTQSPSITTTLIPTVIDSPEIENVGNLDFSELEGLKVRYYTSKGIENILLSSVILELGCCEREQVVDWDEIATFNNIHSARISPNGGEIVFMSHSYSYGRIPDLYLYNLETGRSYRLTETPDYSESDMHWAPDGNTLVYKAHRAAGGHSNIRIINKDGCCLQTIPKQGSYDTSPSWSPNGTQIAFSSSTGNTSQLFVYDLYNQEVNKLVSELMFNSTYRLTWSPDGTKIAVLANFEDNTDICIVDIGSNNYFCVNEAEYTESSPSWSPDGTKLIYSAYKKNDSHSHNIYQIDAEGTKKIQLTSLGMYVTPSWISERFFICENYGTGQILIFSIDGSWHQQITFDED